MPTYLVVTDGTETATVIRAEEKCPTCEIVEETDSFVKACAIRDAHNAKAGHAL